MGPILINIFIADLFLVIEDIDVASYADNNTIYCSNDCFNNVVASLLECANKLFRWFSDSQMKGNTDKCNLILSTESDAEIGAGESYS